MKDLALYFATKVSSGDLPKTATDSQVQQIVITILNLGGAIALLVIVVSGFRYILSAGEPEKAAKAKNGIVYALVGLLVLLAARAIVAFVAQGLKGS